MSRAPKKPRAEGGQARRARARSRVWLLAGSLLALAVLLYGLGLVRIGA